ncbi:MAG: chromosomal replication initiator protein DnaA [Butyrivibrio sp.]|nr:chromosomal replication initiator protein DnaA [Butyrivibrio sp.]
MLNEIIGKWDEILKLMKEEFDIADVSFKTWILPLKVYSVKEDVISIIVPEEQTGLKYIEKKYTHPFKVTISEVMNHEFDIKFISTNELKKLSDRLDNETDKARTDYSTLGINPKLTFDTFVVGENNNFAHAASLAVAESPGEVYNPLFIYGGVGLGKTHLMQAIANFIMHNNPSLKVQYVTSEVFTNELIESIRTEKNTSNKSFREKYRSVDVLLIDDIQFIIGKESTQDEFFHTFNTLREAKKQIIISSDRAPKNFETLEERLRSRFEWGVLADISPPNYETRMAILHKKEELESYNVDNEILDYIATNVKSNIRELEGSLNKLVAYSRLTHREINLTFAEEVLKDIISPNAQREVTPDLIIQTVADHFGITTADISSQRRSNEIAYPRQIAMYLCRFMTDVPYETIGSYMGKRDHSTVKYGVDKISKELKSDTGLANTIDVIMKKINPS